MTPFALTPQTFRPTRCQVSTDGGQAWHDVTEGEFARIVERSSSYPDDVRERLSKGETVRLDREPGTYARRRPTAVESRDAQRQVALWS